MADKRLIPSGIKDQSTEAFNELIERLGTIDLVPLLIYIIDSVDASALPHLAWQFHIEGWELAQTEEEKRSLIKRAIELHRHKGTLYAIKKALEALSLEGEIKEWFQYQGEPFKFKIIFTSTYREFTPELLQKLLNLVDNYKNARSHLESIDIAYINKYNTYLAAGAVYELTNTALPMPYEWLALGQGYCTTGGIAEITMNTKN